MKKNNFLRVAAVLLVFCLFSCAVSSLALAKFKAEAQVRTGLSARVASFRVLVNGVDIVTPFLVDIGTVGIGTATLTLPLYTSESSADDTHDLYEWDFSALENLFADDIRHVEKDINPGFYVGDYLGEENTAVLAPGTGGKIQFLVENLSEVPIKYEVTFSNMTNDGIPLEFTDDEGFLADEWEDDMNADNAMSDVLPAWNGIDGSSGPHTNKLLLDSGLGGTVYWRWVFERLDYGPNLALPGTDPIPGLDKFDNLDGSLGIDAQKEPIKLSVDIEIRVTQLD